MMKKEQRKANNNKKITKGMSAKVVGGSIKWMNRRQRQDMSEEIRRG
jgi:hypothetical protein